MPVREGMPDLPEALDSARLAKILAALASPVRVDLMKALRTPKTAAEIRLRPQRGVGGLERPMSRVAVRRHLERLLAIGVVRSQVGLRDGRRTTFYVVHHRQTFALTEELRRLALIRADSGDVPDGTQIGPVPRRPPTGHASLTLVNGVYEGRQVPLAPQGRSAWSIGRAAGADVSVDYDPFASLRHAEVQARDGSFWLVDLGSRNGTSLNWERVPQGVPQPLCAGDVVGVGRSTLVFRSG